MSIRALPPSQLLLLLATPRVAPLGWPHVLVTSSGPQRVHYHSVYVKPDGTGWTTTYDDSLVFADRELDKVLESFYESAGPYPFDFDVHVVNPIWTHDPPMKLYHWHDIRRRLKTPPLKKPKTRPFRKPKKPRNTKKR